MLTRFLREDPDVTELVESRSGEDARAVLARGTADVVFMDVRMPGIDGFAALAGRQPNAPLAGVFCTAYEEHALRASDAGAAAYLLKPFDRARFVQAFDRAKTRVRQEALYAKGAELSRILDPAAPAEPRAVRRLALPTPSGVERIAQEEIDWVEAADKHVRIHTAAGTIQVRRALAELEALLDPAQFLRVHRCNVARGDRVHALRRTDGGATYLELASGARVVVSRSRLREVREALA